jgi:hypothetical protein
MKGKYLTRKEMDIKMKMKMEMESDMVSIRMET